jgi:hypothetical protein
MEESKPSNILSGISRDVPQSWTNRWAGAMTDNGAWIALTWTEPQEIGVVQITFDSGFERELTLSEQASAIARVEFGPQPETVKDYAIEYQPAESDAYQELVRVTGNFQRLRRHSFDAVNVQSIRITIQATNGSDLARIYEVRCYAKTPTIEA